MPFDQNSCIGNVEILFTDKSFDRTKRAHNKHCFINFGKILDQLPEGFASLISKSTISLKSIISILRTQILYTSIPVFPHSLTPLSSREMLKTAMACLHFSLPPWIPCLNDERHRGLFNRAFHHKSIAEMSLGKSITLCIALLAYITGLSQKVTLNGYVTDKKTGERLLGASIFLVNKNLGTTSNAYGFYSLTVAPDSVEVSFSYTGYQAQVQKFLLKEDKTLNIELEQSKALDVVVVKASKKESIQNRTQMSTIDLPVSMIKSLPAFLGEPDVLKAIQLLPGVRQVVKVLQAFMFAAAVPIKT